MLVASFSGARVVMDNKGGLKSIIESGLPAYRLVFPPTLLSCSSRFLRALQQNRESTGKASLFVKCLLVLVIVFFFFFEIYFLV